MRPSPARPIGRRLAALALLALAAALAPRPATAQAPALHRIGVLAQDLQPGLLEDFRDVLKRLWPPSS